MGFKLFDELSNEELVNEKVVVALDAVEMIEAGEAFASIESLSAEADMAKETIALSETIVASMESQVDSEKAVIAKPESVSSSTVILSMESLQATAAILGAEVPATMSTEAIEASPVSALEIAIEAKQSLIGRVVASIKALFKKFVAILKKLYVKAVVAMNGTAKQAEALKKKIEDTKDGKDVEVDEKLLKLINAKVGGAMVKLEAKEFDAKFVKDLMDRILNGRGVKAASETISVMAGKIDKAISGADKEMTGKEVMGIIKDISPVGGVISRYDGAGVKTLVVKYPEIKDDDKLDKQGVINAIAKVTFTTKTAEASKVTVKTIKWSELATIVGEVVKPAEGIKDFSKKIDGMVSEAEKVVSGLKEGDDDKKYLPVTKLANTIIANVGMDMVLGYMGAIKGVLSVVAAASKTSGKEEMKDEKKEEK